MPTIFTRIITGEIPGEFCWKDDICVAFADINPITPGHVLLVPRREVENYWDAPSEELQHLIKVAQIIGRAQRQAFGSQRSCLSIAGFDVPHLHLHLIPANSMEDIKFAHAQPATPKDIATSMQALRQALAAQGYASEAGINA
ncbi:HIT family protein [Varibaculum vaginae]|uniref:HIT family protein n=1 Tax=Varibaculum vaginae TaxID=2364797 RepID=UPI000F077916|nr:HIT family protein [Varibaculum vaginae]